MIYFDNPQCGDLVLGPLDNAIHHGSLRGIGESSSNEKVTLLEHTKLREAFLSHFATTDLFTRASK